MIIDFHTHTFPDAISQRTIEKLSSMSHMYPYTDGSKNGLLDSMKENGVNYSVTLPVATKASQVSGINDQVIATAEASFNDGLILFGGMHPDLAAGNSATADSSYKMELKRLSDNGIKGVKLHPAFQDLDINNISYKRIMDYASELGLIILIHAGYDISFMHHDFASIDAILDIVDTVHPEKFVLAHMGGWMNWENVKKYIAGADVYLDTAFAISKIKAKPGHEDLIEFKENMSLDLFYEVSKAHGCDRILYASDSPWSHQGEYINYINNCPFDEQEKSAILGKNAEGLLRL